LVAILTAPTARESLARPAPEAPFQLAVPSPGVATSAVELPAGAPPPLCLTEIFSNAGRGSDDASHEWVELFNPTDAPVNLRGWRIADNAASDILGGDSIPAGGHVVLAGGAEAVVEFGATEASIVIGDGWIGNGLANGGDVVTLQDPVGRVVDSVDYRAPPLPLPEEGWSIALTDDGWVLSTAPSQGRGAVESLLASAVITPGTDAVPVPTTVAETDDSGVPAWVLVAIAPEAASGTPGAIAAWQRRGARRHD
jgi:hypothetical protein